LEEEISPIKKPLIGMVSGDFRADPWLNPVFVRWCFSVSARWLSSRIVFQGIVSASEALVLRVRSGTFQRARASEAQQCSAFASGDVRERERERESILPHIMPSFCFAIMHTTGLQGALNSVHFFLGHLWLSSCACRLDAVSMVAIPAGFPFELQLSTDCFYNFQAVNTIACILRRANRVGKKAGGKAAFELIILKDSSIARSVRF